MADALNGDDLPPLLLVKKKKLPPAAHGGAWKIAYADFVTAMMAFFLLLWLLNATTEEAMMGISDYFAPTSVAEDDNAMGEAMKGLALSIEGAMRSASSRPSITVALPTYGEEESGDLKGEARKDEDEVEVNTSQSTTVEGKQDLLDEAMAKLRQSIEEIPDFKDLQDSLLIDVTPEGLRIQILDQEKKAMFKENTAVLTKKARRLLALVGSLISRLPNKVSITGHTEENDFQRDAKYGNWELSGDRAAVARKWLVDAGVGEEQIIVVTGKASTDLLEIENPASERNRRISILLVNVKP